MMTPQKAQLVELRDLIRAFTLERDWDQFHTPKNLAMALTVEVAELLEHFQWLNSGMAQELKEETLLQVKHEVADVLIYLIRFADKMEIDLDQAVREKLVLNNEKYPANKVRGDSRKYNEY